MRNQFDQSSGLPAGILDAWRTIEEICNILGDYADVINGSNLVDVLENVVYNHSKKPVAFVICAAYRNVFMPHMKLVSYSGRMLLQAACFIDTEENIMCQATHLLEQMSIATVFSVTCQEFVDGVSPEYTFADFIAHYGEYSKMAVRVYETLSELTSKISWSGLSISGGKIWIKN